MVTDPFPAPVNVVRGLFGVNVKDSGIKDSGKYLYRPGGHIGVWLNIPDIEVGRLLCTLNL